MNIALLSNVNLESLALRLRSDHNVYFPGGYDVWAQQFIDPDSSFYGASPEDCFVIADAKGNFDCDAAKLAITAAAKTLPRCDFYVSTLGISSPAISPLKESFGARGQEFGWNAALSEMISEYGNIYPLDISGLVEQHGREKFYSPKMWYLSGNPFSAFGEIVLSGHIGNILKFKKHGRKKCLILDLDNTLWGGVIGEDGIDGIELDLFKEGARYRDFQQGILAIKNTGVLLAIASKNNLEDAEAAFRHPNMLLKQDDFIARKINWRPKSENISEIAAELNIGLDSLVFVDDNPVERAEVKESLPGVAVPDFPLDTCCLGEFAGSLFNDHFYILDISDEDRNKHRMYAENKEREGSKGSFGDIAGYLRNLNITLKLEELTDRTLLRAHQMTQKTNQFNLTTRRYSEAELREMMTRPDYLVMIGQVADKFGDNGYSVLIVCGVTDGKTAEIESFLMSCRIMGRTVERAALRHLEDILMRRGIENLRASYIFTKKNAPVENFYDSMGYALVERDENNNKFYSHALPDAEMGAGNCFVTVI